MVMPKTVNGIRHKKNIVKSDIFFSNRPPWLRSIVKYDCYEQMNIDEVLIVFRHISRARRLGKIHLYFYIITELAVKN